MTDLAALRDRVERLAPEQQLEALRILRAGVAEHLTENQNGTFVDLTALPPDVVASLEAYVAYVRKQQAELAEAECERERIQAEFFNGNKETVTETEDDHPSRSPPSVFPASR